MFVYAVVQGRLVSAAAFHSLSSCDCLACGPRTDWGSCWGLCVFLCLQALHVLAGCRQLYAAVSALLLKAGSTGYSHSMVAPDDGGVVKPICAASVCLL
jgi:hypothetical protein